mmetsp:Transcript_15780/g.22906  ORF Transcript_15780/g.22906 Transcript_15780/m.22906 type:complete len:142 (+) Transcript_15780:65-490(+)
MYLCVCVLDRVFVCVFEIEIDRGTSSCESTLDNTDRIASKPRSINHKRISSSSSSSKQFLFFLHQHHFERDGHQTFLFCFEKNYSGRAFCKHKNVHSPKISRFAFSAKYPAAMAQGFLGLSFSMAASFRILCRTSSSSSSL